MSSHDPTPERDALVMAAKADVARALAQHPDLTLAETIRVLTEEAAAYARLAIRDERAARARAPALQPRADVRCTCGWSAVAADPDDAFAGHIASMTMAHDERTHRITGIYMPLPPLRTNP
jgi:hypothetical protein